MGVRDKKIKKLTEEIGLLKLVIKDKDNYMADLVGQKKIMRVKIQSLEKEKEDLKGIAKSLQDQLLDNVNGDDEPKNENNNVSECAEMNNNDDEEGIKMD